MRFIMPHMSSDLQSRWREAKNRTGQCSPRSRQPPRTTKHRVPVQLRIIVGMKGRLAPGATSACGIDSLAPPALIRPLMRATPTIL